MGKFLIKPQLQQHQRLYDNLFLWHEKNIYIMANHRLALWCWLQCENLFEGKHALIHIDEHFDARKWEAAGEPECLQKAISTIQKLKNFNEYENLQCPFRKNFVSDRDMRPCITWDNFVYLATKANLFNHYYIYSSVGDWNTELPKTAYNCREKISDVYNFDKNIKKYSDRCIVDVDLDFFDYRDEFPKKISEDELLIKVFKIITDNLDNISMITISINESPNDELWGKRQHQLKIIKDILGMSMPIPIMKS